MLLTRKKEARNIFELREQDEEGSAPFFVVVVVVVVVLPSLISFTKLRSIVKSRAIA